MQSNPAGACLSSMPMHLVLPTRCGCPSNRSKASQASRVSTGTRHQRPQTSVQRGNGIALMSTLVLLNRRPACELAPVPVHGTIDTVATQPTCTQPHPSFRSSRSRMLPVPSETCRHQYEMTILCRTLQFHNYTLPHVTNNCLES